MQYVLTTEEFEFLKERERVADNLPSIELLNATCIKIAEKLVSPGYLPHGCIHASKVNGHCNKCPALNICRLPQSFIK